MATQLADRIREKLRRVTYPGFSRDIVAQGFVRRIDVDEGVVTVFFGPNTRNEEKVQRMTDDICKEVSDMVGVEQVRVERVLPFGEDSLSEGGTLTPLQAELLQDGIRPETDVLATALPRTDLAPEAGYGPEGPVTVPSPEGPSPKEFPPEPGSPEAVAAEIPRDVYEGTPRVFQWEIDPAAPAAECGEIQVKRGGWEYDIWWQSHPAELVYVSIQAMGEEQASGPERQHPMGRNVVVNLVYDRRREGIAAIYGTARDFRPFVDAFREAFGLDEEQPVDPASGQKEDKSK
jgi:metal-sulfur cluster biosynthetic enzyme